MIRRMEHCTSMDTGFSWVILLASTIIFAILSGWAKTYGILYTQFINYYKTGSGNTAWIGSVNSLLFFALGPISNYLCEVYSFKSVVTCGGILFSVGTFASAFVTRMEVLYVTIGLIAGLGGGFVFTPACTIVSFYFEKRRGFANAMMISGAGIATFSFPYFYPYLLDKYGLHGTLLILSALIANICVCSLLFRQPSQLIRVSCNKGIGYQERELSNISQTGNPNREISNENRLDRDQRVTAHGSVKQCRKRQFLRLNLMDVFDFSLFHNSRFCLHSLAYTTHTFGYISSYSVLPAYILDLGFDKTNVAVALSVAGAAEIISKLFFGWLVDLKYFKIQHVLFTTFAVSGLAAMFIPFFHNHVALYVYAGIVGIFGGAYFSLMAVVLLDFIPLTRLPKSLGLTTLCMSFGGMLGQPIAGWIEDASGSWTHSFRYIGTMHLIAALFAIIQPCISKDENTVPNDHDTDNSFRAKTEKQDTVQFVTQAEIEMNVPL